MDARLKAKASTAITYTRGPLSAALVARLGSTDFEEVREDGYVTNSRSKDFIVTAADLVLGGVKAEPAKGDEIRIASAAGTEVYEVTSPGGDKPWRYTGSGEHSIRIHTKQIDTEV